MSKTSKSDVPEVKDESPAPPRPPRASGGLIKLQAIKFYKNGQILPGEAVFYDKTGKERHFADGESLPAEVAEGEYIDVTPNMYRQIKEDSKESFVPVQ